MTASKNAWWVGQRPTRLLVLWAVVLCTGCSAIAQSPDAKSAIPPGMILNEDNSHFFGRSSDKMTLEGLDELVDRFAGTQVTSLFLCVNAQRVNYDSKVWTSRWQDLDPDTINANNWIRNTKLLHDRGLDPYAVWIDRCRQKNISPWISMRMNDIHGVRDINSNMHSRFWKQHPEYWRVPGSTTKEKRDRALDYGIPEVREYNLALIRELLDRYDMDGLELDWMRWGFHFKPGHESQGVVILNDFMRQVRRMTRTAAAKRGHPIQLAVRVPAVPENAVGLGMDAVTWARQYLIDVLIPTPFFASDFDIPVDRWRTLIGPAADRIILAPAMEYRIRSTKINKPIVDTPETLRGFIAAMLYCGADRIYLFNHMDAGPDIIDQKPTLQATVSQPRRHIVTFHDTVPPGVPRTESFPQKFYINECPAQFRLYTGPVPKTGSVRIRIGLEEHPDLAGAVFAARLNSQPCSPLPDPADPQNICKSSRVIAFDAPRSAMQPGYNLVEVFLTQGPKKLYVDWAEIVIIP